jgi:hypothetical protein
MDVPSGTVILWTGTAANIPTGWTKYTSAVGRFVRGTPAGQSAGATGGNAPTHTHNMGSVLTGGAHTHGSVGFTYASSSFSAYRKPGSNVGVVGIPHNHTASVELGSGGAHTHDFDGTTTGAPVGDANPPYKKGIYIVKS